MNLSNLDSINIIKLHFFEEDRDGLIVAEELNHLWMFFILFSKL